MTKVPGTFEDPVQAAMNSSTFQSRAKDEKPMSVRLDNVRVLHGQEDYHIWAATMNLVWRSMKVYDLVVLGAKPADDATTEEIEAWQTLSHQAAAVYIQVVSPEILEKIVELDNPHDMWIHLKSEFYRDTAFALVSQVASLASLSVAYDKEVPIASFVSKFETEWLRLQKLAKASSDSYRQTFAKFLQEDKAKRDFLLGFLVTHEKNVVDNLSTKDELSYAEVKQRLLDLDSVPSDGPSHSAFATNDLKIKTSSKSNKFCTWCKKHHPAHQNGHTWSTCSKLKRYNDTHDSLMKDQSDEPEMNETHAAVHESNKVSSPSFYLDTCASSHMCPNLGRFESLSLCTGSVKSSSGDIIPIKGKGNVVMDCLLGDGTVSSFRIHDVLYVPDVCRPLFSFRKAMEKGYRLEGENKLLRLLKENKVILEAIFDGTLPRIREVEDFACASFEFWHKALGHAAPSSISKTGTSVSTEEPIPPCPDHFFCHECQIAKSTHAKPRSVESRSNRAGEYLHSDLCGPFPVTSYSGASYYISFVDDRSRFAWVKFLKVKSDATSTTAEILNHIETQYDVRVKRFRSDNGGEYTSNALETLFAKRGIVHDTTPPYSPESNGVAERLNRSIGEGIRAMLCSVKDKHLWAEAVNTFVYVKNRQSHHSLGGGETPFEALFGIKPSITHLQPFGRPCYVHVPKAKRLVHNKFQARAQNGLFVGYTKVNHHLRVFLPDLKRTVVSADVRFPPMVLNGNFNESVTETSGSPDVAGQPIDIGRHDHEEESITVPVSKGFPSDENWLNWMERNPKTAIDWALKGHPKVEPLFINAYNNGKRDGFLDSKYFHETSQSFPSDRNNENDDADVQENHRERELSEPAGIESNSSSNIEMQTTEPDHLSPAPSLEQNVDQLKPPVERGGSPVQYTTRYGRRVQPPSDVVTPNWMMNHQREQPTHSVQPIANPNAMEVDDDGFWEEELATDETDSISVLSVEEPKTLSQAQNGPDWSQWKCAMDEELQSLQENHVWDVVSRPKDRRIVGGKWVFKVKGNEHGELDRFKARYVAQGFSQVQGLDYDEIFAPVAKYDSLRLLLAISACNNWKPRQVDIKTAFLYGVLKEDVFMKLPEGCGYDTRDHVAKLKRCIYGLKQSPREWFLRLLTFLRPKGFVPSVFDPCVLMHDSGRLFLAVYVDDISLFGESGHLLENTIRQLKSEFKVNDLGLLHWLLGVQIEYSETGISLSQTAFISRILSRFSMEQCNPVKSPLDTNVKLQKSTADDKRTEKTSYQRMIGSLMYLVTGTRPDIAYAIAHLSQFSSDPAVTHMAAVKRLLRYLQGTKTYKLFYNFGDEIVLNGFCDASYGNCLDTRRSFSGYLFQLGNSTISWRSRKQRSVAHSSCEAEYMALSLAVKQYIWLRSGLRQLSSASVPMSLSTDSNAAVDLASNPKLNDASKHIDIAYHFTREKVNDGTLTLLHVPSSDNLADICTKGLPWTTHNHLCTSIFGTK